MVVIQDPVYGGNKYDYGQTGRRFGGLTNAISDATREVDQTGRHIEHFFFDVKFTKGLTLENRVGAQYYNSSRDNKGDAFYGGSASQNGSIFKTKGNYNVLNLLRYKTNFGAHGFEALVAHENNKLTNSFLSAYRTNLFDPNGLNNAIVQQNSNSYIEGVL
jgi:hypothetical protein